VFVHGPRPPMTAVPGTCWCIRGGNPHARYKSLTSKTSGGPKRARPRPGYRIGSDPRVPCFPLTGGGNPPL
jgi:hypothetical protein